MKKYEYMSLIPSGGCVFALDPAGEKTKFEFGRKHAFWELYGPVEVLNKYGQMGWHLSAISTVGCTHYILEREIEK